MDPTNQVKSILPWSMRIRRGPNRGGDPRMETVLLLCERVHKAHHPPPRANTTWSSVLVQLNSDPPIVSCRRYRPRPRRTKKEEFDKHFHKFPRLISFNKLIASKRTLCLWAGPGAVAEKGCRCMWKSLRWLVGAEGREAKSKKESPTKK